MIHQGAAHDIHDPAGIDKAAAVFAAKYVSTPTSVSEDDSTPINADMRWTLFTLHGETVARDLTPAEIRALPDGVYAAWSDGSYRKLLVRSGVVYTAR